MAVSQEKTSDTGQTRTRHQFGTFGGVFTPAILTILGVIMFMRANFVVGQAGVIGAVLILLVAKSITCTTSLSIAAISTNMRVRGGGSYFLISRVLGAEFGGAIGIALFFALALSVPFYILGFTEALILSYPSLAPHFQAIALTSAVVLFIVSFFGAGLAIRTQYLIMVFLFLAVGAFLNGAASMFSIDLFRENTAAAYSAVAPDDPAGGLYSFWTVFAIYFPAVTGIDAGLNMSGDLRDPGRSIPRGTFAAVGIGFTIYLLQIVLAGGAFDRSSMIEAPYETLRESAVFGWTALITLGVMAATLSSALGSYLGAPRVLQAVSRDKILLFLRFFAKGTAKGDEPRRALFFTFFITVAVLLWAGNETGGTALNAVAAIITMFFLYSYGMINIAAFAEDFSGNPSFRPRFRYFHWAVALLGGLGSLGVAFLINWIAALAAVILVAALLLYLQTQSLKAAFGDIRRGFVYQSARNKLLTLRTMEEDPKNWRPNALVFSGNPQEREDLITYAIWLEARRGIVYLANVLIGNPVELAPRRLAALKQLNRFCGEKEHDAFPVVVVAEKLEDGIVMLLQATAVGPIQPNVAIFGWSAKMERRHGYLNELRVAAGLGMSLVIVEPGPPPDMNRKKRIDVWWRGEKNGGLMLLFAFLLTNNWEWGNSEIRLLRVVEKEAGREPAAKALEELIQGARMSATVRIIVSSDPFPRILRQYSLDAACVFLGFELPGEAEEMAWHATYRSHVSDMPTVILVNSTDSSKLLE